MSEAADALEAEAADLTPEAGATDGQQTAEHDASGDSDEAIEHEALAMGWKPESQFKGPKDKFVSAAEYVERGKTILPFLNKELSKAYREIEGLKKAVQTSIQYMSKAEQRGYEKARAELEAELDAAAAAGNAEDVRAITKDIVALEKEVAAPAEAEEAPATNPDFEAFKAENDWFGTDKPLTAAFNAICAELKEEGYSTPKVGLKEGLKRLKEEFPHKFEKPENPNRRLPGAVEGSTVPAKRGKTFADLPPDARQMCDEMCRDIKGFTREKYVKTYDWS